MADFAAYFPQLLAFEGGYADDPADPGGARNRGIALAVFQAHARALLAVAPTVQNLRALSEPQAAALYKALYWDRIDGDAIALQALAELVFDFYVDAGFHAIALLQRLLGPPLAADGVFGPDTLKALRESDQPALYLRYRQGRIDYYTDLASAHPLLRRFLAGWLRRAEWFPARAQPHAHALPAPIAAPTMRAVLRLVPSAMSNAPVVRPAQPDDRAAVLALLAETFADTWRPQLTAQAIADYHDNRVAERYVDAQLAQLLVAELDGKVLGFAGRDGGFVDSLHVGANGRRRGIARALMQALETAMRGEGLALASLETDTFNTGSQALYLALGYRETARYPDEEWNSGLTTIRYEKAL